MLAEQDETSALLRQSAASFIKDMQARTDVNRSASWQDMVSLGWGGVLLPEAVGGSGLGIEHAAILMEVMGEHGFDTPLLTGVFLPSILLADMRGDGARSLLERIADGSLQAPLAWQERIGQIDPETPATVLRQERLSGRKLFVPGVDTAATLIVSVRTDDDEFALVAVLPQAGGVEVDAFDMNDGSRSAAIAFLDVEVGPADVIATGPTAAEAMKRAMTAGALLRSAQLSGLARATLESTIRFLHQRSQFGQKLSGFQVLQHRVADLYGLTRLADASWNSALCKYRQDPHSRETHIAVSAAKARCSDVANQVAKAAIQLHGAFGFTADSGMGAALFTALAWSTSFGAAEAHRRKFHELSEAAA